jgi:hypothetical protein
VAFDNGDVPASAFEFLERDDHLGAGGKQQHAAASFMGVTTSGEQGSVVIG